jgi:hypothetical protein
MVSRVRYSGTGEVSQPNSTYVSRKSTSVKTNGV